MNNLIINEIDYSIFDLEWAKRGGVVLKVGIHSAFLNYLKTECVIDNYHCHYFAHLNSNLGYGDTYTTNTFCDLRMATPAECAKAGIDYIEPPMMWRDIESAPVGKRLILFLKTIETEFIYIGGYSDGEWLTEEGKVTNTPHGWMPLPQPPKDE